MEHYSIKVQFADPNGPEFSQIEEVIRNAINYYNQKSLLATNPKSIIEYNITANTLELTLESKAELPYPSKALQTFSRYLVDPYTENSLNKFVYGHQLFKMSSKKLNNKGSSEFSCNEEGIDFLRIKAISMIITASKESLNNVIRILKEDSK